MTQINMTPETPKPSIAPELDPKQDVKPQAAPDTESPVKVK
jgi:hypothetical protein